jgi:uncharacterized protein (TIGR02270 family)
MVEGLRALAAFAGTTGVYADCALNLLLRCLSLERANTFLRSLASDPQRRRTVIRATGVIGDALYLPWLVDQTSDPAAARLAGGAFATITGADLVYLGLDRPPPPEFQPGPSDDPDDINVALDEEHGLPWPDPEKLARWWSANRARFNAGTAYFLGSSKASTDWLSALSNAFQHQRRSAALELGLRQPTQAMFEMRSRARVQIAQLEQAGKNK